jgi:hypothetical protein
VLKQKALKKKMLIKLKNKKKKEKKRRRYQNGLNIHLLQQKKQLKGMLRKK